MLAFDTILAKIGPTLFSQFSLQLTKSSQKITPKTTKIAVLIVHDQNMICGFAFSMSAVCLMDVDGAAGGASRSHCVASEGNEQRQNFKTVFQPRIILNCPPPPFCIQNQTNIRLETTFLKCIFLGPGRKG